MCVICSLQATTKNCKNNLKNHHIGSRLLQDSINAVVTELLVTRISRFKRSLNFRGWIPRKGDLEFKNLETRFIKDDAIIFAKIAIDMIAIVSVIDHLLGESSVKSTSDVSKGLTAALKQVPPGPKDIVLLGKLLVKPVWNAYGEMVTIKGTPDRRVHGKELPARLEILQHFFECQRQPVDVLKTGDRKDEVVLIEMIITEILSITVVVTVSLTELEKPLLLRKIAMKLISLAEFFVVGGGFNSSPAVAAQMVDHQ